MRGCLLVLGLEADQLQPGVDDGARQRRRVLRPDQVRDQLAEDAGEEADDLRPADQPHRDAHGRQHRRQEVLDVRRRALAFLQVLRAPGRTAPGPRRARRTPAPLPPSTMTPGARPRAPSAPRRRKHRFGDQLDRTRAASPTRPRRRPPARANPRRHPGSPASAAARAPPLPPASPPAAGAPAPSVAVRCRRRRLDEAEPLGEPSAPRAGSPPAAGRWPSAARC